MYSIIARFDVKSRQRKQKFRVFCRKREKIFAKDIDKSDLRCYNSQVNFAGMAQLVEQLIRNQQVAGSSPATSSKKSTCIKQVLFLTEFAVLRQVKGLRREMYLRCVKYLLRGC